MLRVILKTGKEKLIKRPFIFRVKILFYIKFNLVLISYFLLKQNFLKDLGVLFDNCVYETKSQVS
jgi:hypothetical protein